MRRPIGGLVLVVVAVAGCSAASSGDASTPTTIIGHSATTSNPTPSRAAGVTWEQARARFLAAHSFTFQGNARLVDHTLQITQLTHGEVNRVADASRVAVAVTSPDPKLTIPGEMVVLSVGKALWMQMSGWKAPNRGKWLDLAAQGKAGVGQSTQLEDAILAFKPATGPKGWQFSGKAPLAKTVALLGIRNLPDTVTVDGDVAMVITVDDKSGITHVRVDGGGLTGSSLPSDYAGLVLGSTFDAQVDLEAGPVAVKAPPKDLIITSSVPTG